MNVIKCGRNVPELSTGLKRGRCGRDREESDDIASCTGKIENRKLKLKLTLFWFLFQNGARFGGKMPRPGFCRVKRTDARLFQEKIKQKIKNRLKARAAAVGSGL